MHFSQAERSTTGTDSLSACTEDLEIIRREIVALFMKMSGQLGPPRPPIDEQSQQCLSEARRLSQTMGMLASGQHEERMREYTRYVRNLLKISPGSNIDGLVESRDIQTITSFSVESYRTRPMSAMRNLLGVFAAVARSPGLKVVFAETMQQDYYVRGALGVEFTDIGRRVGHIFSGYPSSLVL